MVPDTVRSSSSSSAAPNAPAAAVPRRLGLTVARVLLGLVFFVFGLNGFLHFIPQPPVTGAALAFFTGLVASGYFLPLLALTQVVSGALLLANRYVPLALTLLAPVIVNIVAYHAAMDLKGMPLALVVLALELVLAAGHRAAFRPLFAARA